MCCYLNPTAVPLQLFVMKILITHTALEEIFPSLIKPNIDKLNALMKK